VELMDYSKHPPATIRHALEAVLFLSTAFAHELGGTLDPLEADLAVALDRSAQEGCNQ
jgi:hypothetical protein